MVDANVMFAALIRAGMTRSILYHIDIRCFAPEFIFKEYDRYRRTIKTKSKMSDRKFQSGFSVVRRRIHVVPEIAFKSCIEHAREISPDINDMLYFAVALSLNIPIWSNDRALREGQDEVWVYSTEDLVRMLGLDVS